MRIVYIIPGSGTGFYCENCRRDLILIRALKRLGHEVTIMPLYLPLPVNGDGGNGGSPVFYGAVKYFLRQNVRLLRSMPVWLEKFLDSRGVLKWAESMAGTTRAKGHEKMTLSMLNGEPGNADPELKRVVHYLKDHIKPQIIHISNSLLIGMATRVKEELGIPVVCTLQDEDSWLDSLEPPYREQAWSILSEKSGLLDHFFSVSEYYKKFILERVKMPEGKISVIYPGIEPPAAGPKTLPASMTSLGFFSRMSEDHGLGILTDAFIRLSRDMDIKDAHLYATGGFTKDDRPFIRSLQKKIRAGKLEKNITFLTDTYRTDYALFFDRINVLSVPVLKGEAFGLYLLEALGRGIPVVQPDLGSYREIIEKTGGGILYSPNSSLALAEALYPLLKDPSRLKVLGEKGRAAVRDRFSIDRTASSIVEVYTRSLTS
jgi:glycosyltransferase involved in cell wall biosynthesis